MLLSYHHIRLFGSSDTLLTEPALGHEYQFTLDDAGKLALERSLGFLDSIAK
ncbi:hypothetical protein [Aquiflexum lacus]|uniref:hypothetical protein n=1 Tax=Aquiflexum lacus TaxID=2483805 RepID=UPI0018951CE5|nr:hypothetical protein [Aquiflexum lacus]